MDFQNLIRPLGRTFFVDMAKAKAFHFNWSYSGAEITFRGSLLKARLLSQSYTMPLPPNFPGEPVTDYPCVGVIEGGELQKRFCLKEEDTWITLYEGEEGIHTLELRKLSENIRGKVALLDLQTDGELCPPAAGEAELRLEFIGDSITCGYGNEALNRDDPFTTEEENAHIAYGPLCRAILQEKTGRSTDISLISYSGICAGRPKYPMMPGFMPCMLDLYPYTDKPTCDNLSREAEPWDFAKHPKDIIVINLGTNDVNPVRFNPDFDKAAEEEAHFGDNYIELLTMVRKLNGEKPYIVCTLGPMDHYLFDVLRDRVEAYIKETGDQKVLIHKFIGINLMSEGFGAVGHPSAKTHERMSRELAKVLLPLV